MKSFSLTASLALLGCLCAPGQPLSTGEVVEDKIVLGGPVAPDGQTEVQCDLPVSERRHNTGGKDGSGLCVFTSIEHAARWQNESLLNHFQADMKKEPGGGYPEKVDRMIAKYGPGAQYLQYEGRDPELLKAAIKTGRMPCVTYNGHDPHYGGSIAHMVNLVHLDDRWACILDNNFIEESQLVWMKPEDFYRRWRGGNGSGWTVILLSPPPPPIPRNGEIANGKFSIANFKDNKGLLSICNLQFPSGSHNPD